MPSEEYLIARTMVTQRLREKAEPVFEALSRALNKLQESGWSRELPIRQIGGNRFAYAFHEQYELSFRVKDQKPSFQPPEEMWLELLTLPLRNRDLESG